MMKNSPRYLLCDNKTNEFKEFLNKIDIGKIGIFKLSTNMKNFVSVRKESFDILKNYVVFTCPYELIEEYKRQSGKTNFDIKFIKILNKNEKIKTEELDFEKYPNSIYLIPNKEMFIFSYNNNTLENKLLHIHL